MENDNKRVARTSASMIAAELLLLPLSLFTVGLIAVCVELMMLALYVLPTPTIGPKKPSWPYRGQESSTRGDSGSYRFDEGGAPVTLEEIEAGRNRIQFVGSAEGPWPFRHSRFLERGHIGSALRWLP